MRYLKTVDLWDRANHHALVTGQLKLLPGQWVQCGTGKKSRFVGVTETGSIWAAHWQGNGADTRKRFHTMLNIFRGKK